MSGMIAHCTALQDPGRLQSLRSVMSTLGEPGLRPVTPHAIAGLCGAAADLQRDPRIARFMATDRILESPYHPAIRHEWRAVANQRGDLACTGRGDFARSQRSLPQRSAMRR
jgi:hypothetical protein